MEEWAEDARGTAAKAAVGREVVEDAARAAKAEVARAAVKAWV